MFTCIEVAEKAGLKFGRREGPELLYLCPAHDDHDPSLKINETKDMWMCGPCKASGKAWQLLAFIGNLDPTDRNGVLQHAKALGLIRDNGSKLRSEIVAIYDYTNSSGTILFQVVRVSNHSRNCSKDCDKKKHFYQRRPDDNHGWINNLDGIERVPFKLHSLANAESLFWVEGEKDVLNLERLGFVATTSPQGAFSMKHLPEVTKHLRPSHKVTIIPDNDEAGKDYASKVAALLHGRIAEVRILELPDLPTKGDVSDWVRGKDPEQAAEELSHLAENAPVWKTHNHELKPSGIPVSLVMSADELRAQPLPEREWIITGVLPVRSCSMVFGPTGIGKTRFEISKAIHVVQGVKFLKYEVPKPRRVLFVDGELPMDHLQAIVREFAGSNSLPGLDLISSEKVYQLLGRNLNFNRQEDQNAFLTLLNELQKQNRRPEQIFFDNLSTLFLGAEENSNTEQESSMLFFIQLRHMGYAIEFVHHSGYSGNQRGATRRLDAMDLVVRLDAPVIRNKEGAKFKLSYAKTRFKPPKPFNFDCELITGENGLLTWATSEIDRDLPVWIQVLKWVQDNQPQFQKDIADAFGTSGSAITQHLGKARGKGLMNGLSVTDNGVKFLAKKYGFSDEKS